MATMTLELLRLQIASTLVEIEKMVGNEYRLSLLARHQTNTDAHIRVTSETDEGNLFQCLLELDKKTIGSIQKNAVFSCCMEVARRTTARVIGQIHEMQRLGFEGTLADARDHLTEIFTSAELAALIVGEREPTCEHGVADGAYCEPCNEAYKQAILDNAGGEHPDAEKFQHFN